MKLTLIHSAGRAIAPVRALPPIPQPDAEARAHLSAPLDAELTAWSRGFDVAVWRQGAGPWHISAGRCAAPIDAGLLDAMAGLVVEVSTGYVPVKSAQRIVAMLPGCFALEER